MTRVAFIRHGATAWNTEGRIQGRADLALSSAGAAELRLLCPPAAVSGFRWLASPLRRARQTAATLNGGGAADDRLIETDWGAWEGLSAVVTNPVAARIARRGAAGLDFRPPSGESPRDVQSRLRALLAEIGAQDQGHVCVTHKGVIRAALSLAIGWDMLSKPPLKLRWRAVHLFEADKSGGLALVEANIPLTARAAPCP